MMRKERERERWDLGCMNGANCDPANTILRANPFLEFLGTEIFSCMAVPSWMFLLLVRGKWRRTKTVWKVEIGPGSIHSLKKYFLWDSFKVVFETMDVSPFAVVRVLTLLKRKIRGKVIPKPFPSLPSYTCLLQTWALSPIRLCISRDTHGKKRTAQNTTMKYESVLTSDTNCRPSFHFRSKRVWDFQPPLISCIYISPFWSFCPWLAPFV